MGDLNVIDRFLGIFLRYIDSGFGLLTGEVAFLTTILIGIDVTLAGLFWALEEAPLMARLLRKVLYVGAFAFILQHFNTLSELIYRSFASLGLEVSRNAIASDDLLKPGRLAGIGFEAAWPLLKAAGDLIGVTGLFENFLTIIVLTLAWLIVIAAFFLLAVQLFITVLEFKLTALAGFVLVPFALWSKTAFLAERVLGNVIGAGIKVMVLAVIVGIGAGFFQDFIDALKGVDPNLGQAMSLVLASLALFGFGIFGPGIAAGLVAGAPQLGAGAALGTASAVAGSAMLGGAAAIGAARAAAAVPQTVSAGLAVAGAMIGTRGGGASMPPPLPGAASAIAASGNPAGSQPTAAGASAPPPASAEDAAPAWARALRREQRNRARLQATGEAIRAGDQAMGAAAPDLQQKE